MQRTLSLFLVLVFVFSLSACGMPQEQTDDSAQPSVNSTAAPETEAPDASPEQDTKTICIGNGERWCGASHQYSRGLFFLDRQCCFGQWRRRHYLAQRHPPWQCAAAGWVGTGGDRRRPVFYSGNRSISQRLGCLLG